MHEDHPRPRPASRMSPPDPSDYVAQAWQAHAPGLTRYAQSLTGDPEAARDLVAETFVRLARTPVEKTADHLLPWLLRVCRTRALDRHRKEHRMTPLEPLHLSHAPAPEPAPAAATERAEARHLILRLLPRLTPAQQEALRLRYLHDLSYAEIAEVTGRSVSAVGVLLHEGIKALRQILHRESDLLTPT